MADESYAAEARPSRDPAVPPRRDSDKGLSFTVGTGVRICLLLAFLALVAAIYYYWVPLVINGRGGMFGCGSAANPPTDDFPQAACGDLPSIYQMRASAFLQASLVLAIIGSLLFGLRLRRRTSA